MSTQPTTSSGKLIQPPSHPAGYLAVGAAVITAGIHLVLGPQLLGFSQLLGTLFILNGVGFLGGLVLYLSRYWRRELYLVAAGYALATIFALFAFQGFSLDVFYSQGSLDTLTVVAKAAELVFTLCVGYLYTSDASQLR